VDVEYQLDEDLKENDEEGLTRRSQRAKKHKDYDDE